MSNTTVRAGDTLSISWITFGYNATEQVAFHLLRQNSNTILYERIVVTNVGVGTANYTIPVFLSPGKYFLAATPVTTLALLAVGPDGAFPTTGFTVSSPPPCTIQSDCAAATRYCASINNTGLVGSFCYPCSLCSAMRNALGNSCPDICLQQPLVLGQAVPNVTETLASGPVTSAPGCDKLNTLAYNNNSAVVFAPDTLGSLKHRMSTRLSSRIDTLAAMVKTKFGASVSLLVLEAYLAPSNSSAANPTLQNEGRAAKLSLSPQPADNTNQTNLGILAGLAVIANFDYVLFASPNYIYVSVVGATCRAPIDLVFLLDASGSIEMPDYGGSPGLFHDKVLGFVEQVVSYFSIGPNETRVGVVTFSSTVNVNFNLNTYDNKDDVLYALEYLVSYTGGATYTREGLDAVRTRMFTEAAGMRPASAGVPKVLVVITDGQANAGHEPNVPPSYAADAVKALGVTVFAIGVGSQVGVPELNSMASAPANSHVRVFSVG